MRPVGFLESIIDDEAQEQLRDPKRWSYIVRHPNGMVCAFGRGKTPRACERWAMKHAGEHAEELWINDERWLLEGWRFVLWPPNEKQGGQTLQPRALRRGGGGR